MTAKSRSEKLAFIVYNKGKLPQFLELRKNAIRVFVIGLPIVALICLVAIFALGLYFKQIRIMAQKKEPKIIEQLRTEKAQLQKKLIIQEEFSKELQQKLTSTELPNLASLSLIRPVPGMQDLTGSPVLTIEDAVSYVEKQRTHFRFNIVNLSQGQQKVAGYIVVALKGPNGLYFWPASSMPEQKMQIHFNKGESFAASKLRPVHATFPIFKQSTGDYLFQVFIFSRSGSLLHKQLFAQRINL